MMLDRLARQEQAPGDLGVGEPLAEQGEHFLLPFGEPTKALRPGSGRLDAEITQQGGGGVGVAACSQILKDRQCRPCLGPGHLTVVAPEYLGQQ